MRVNSNDCLMSKFNLMAIARPFIYAFQILKLFPSQVDASKSHSIHTHTTWTSWQKRIKMIQLRKHGWDNIST